MQQITIKYGIDQITRTFSIPVTVKQIKTDNNIRAALGYGDKVRVLQNGVELPDDAILPNGCIVTIETTANEKAN